VSPDVEVVLHFYCSKAFNTETSPITKNADSTFISPGFKNGKKALERFSVHEKSDETAMTLRFYEDRSESLVLKIIGVLQIMARQGLPKR